LVVGGEALRFDALHIGVVDAADVADRVRGDLALRVGAEEPRLDLEAGEAIAVHREARDLLLGQARADRQALEVLAFLLQLPEAAPVARAHVDDRRELVDRALDVGDLARRDLERVGGIVRGEHFAVAVDDEAAVRHHRHHRDAVRLAERVVVLALHDLQPREAAEEKRERGDDREPREHQPVAKDGELALLVAQRLADDHCAAPPRRRRTAGRYSSQLTGTHRSAVRTGDTKNARPGKSAPRRRFRSSITAEAASVRTSTCSGCSAMPKATMRTRKPAAPKPAIT